MFKKLLIANRGEIACRIIRTCQEMGIETVAVYSEADAEGQHVQMADEAYLLGGPAPRDSYLKKDKIIEIALQSGAEAVHPGYGFLSESAPFAQDCEDAGIRFVGPSPEVIEKMGDKLQARRMAKRAGVPVLPGSSKAIDDAHATDMAWSLGFPLMVKAAGGGGGIGIKIIQSLAELESVVHQQRALAASAFGSSTLYFERYMEGASHIEVQVLGDEHGNLVHLMARDCSIQRRNQKIVEESPAIKLTVQQRQRLWNYAVRFAKHVGYTNAGTIEFLVSPDGGMFFLEMNTRLQVEHGVTEMITGLDLVELQLRVASGEELPIKQEDVQCNGHAIETRIYPEDPVTFLPTAGVIENYHVPSGRHVRVDSALRPNYEVTTHYESIIAKLICWGENREEARKHLLDALRVFRLEGIKSNIPLLSRIVDHPTFIDCTYHTDFLASVGPSLGGPETNDEKSNDDHDKELASAIGTALLISMSKGAMLGQNFGERGPGAWKEAGRRGQVMNRTLGSRAWR